jgi:hypothetical protein
LSSANDRQIGIFLVALVLLGLSLLLFHHWLLPFHYYYLLQQNFPGLDEVFVLVSLWKTSYKILQSN